MSVRPAQDAAQDNARRLWPYDRPPTIRDLKTKSCWICLGEAEPQSRRSESRQGWVHACRCSLVAHEACLLTWISSADLNGANPNKGRRCPQCNTKYAIRSKHPFLLRLMNRNYRRVTRLYRYAGYVVIASGFFVGAGLYGAAALRAALGEEAFIYYYGEDMWELAAHGMEFVSVPMTLILGTTGLFNSITIFIPLLYIPHAYRALSDPAEAFQITDYPPGPLVTLLVWPYLRMAYRHAWSILASWITAKPSIRRRRSLWDGIDLVLRIQRDEDNERDGAIVPVDVNQHVEDEPEFEDIPDEDEDEDGANVEREPVGGVQGQGQGEERAGGRGNGGDGENRAEVIRFTEGYLLRVFLSSFFSPFLSNILGRGLKELSNHSSTLQGVLGVRSDLGIQNFGLSTRRSGLSGLLVPMGYNIYGPRDMDPVWWRNAIGLSLFIVVADATTLLHLWLAVRERRSRRIVDRDFQGVDYSGLDLVVDE